MSPLSKIIPNPTFAFQGALDQAIRTPGSNPARNDVGRMVNPRRAEIFALPHPLDAMDDARDNFHSSVRRCSSVVEQRIRNARVVGSIPTTGFPNSPLAISE